MNSDELNQTRRTTLSHGIGNGRGHSVISLNTDMGPYVCVKCCEQRDQCTFNNEPCPADFIPAMRATIPKLKKP